MKYSGGPLQIKDEDVACVYHLVGLVLWGRSCGPDTPSMYTRVNHYLDWIEDRVWPDSMKFE